MTALESTSIYIAIRNADERSHIEDQLVLDGPNVSCFTAAQDLWKHFQPARFVLSSPIVNLV